MTTRHPMNRWTDNLKMWQSIGVFIITVATIVSGATAVMYVQFISPRVSIQVLEETAPLREAEARIIEADAQNIRDHDRIEYLIRAMIPDDEERVIDERYSAYQQARGNR